MKGDDLIIKKYLLLGLITSLSLSLFVGCTQDTSKVNKTFDEKKEEKQSIDLSNKESEDELKDASEEYERLDLLMEKSAKKTKIYGTSLNGLLYDQVQIQVGERKADFIWNTLSADGYLPVIESAELTGDLAEELVFFTTVKASSKVLVQEMHVLNPDTLEEYVADDCVAALNKRITFNTYSDHIDVMIDGVKAKSYKFEELEKIAPQEEWFDFMTISNNIHYEINDGKLQGFGMFEISDGGVVGNFDVTYEYKDMKFITKDIVIS